MDENLIRDLYLNQRWSQEKLATHLGISRSKLKTYLLKRRIVRNEPNVSTGSDKLCPKCSVVKPASEYYVQSYKNGRATRKGSWCKSCMNAQVVIRQRTYKQQAVDYKGGCCQHCGYKEYIGALEFHHLDPSEKDVEMSKFSRAPLSESGKRELDKCVLLCANHHRMIRSGLITL